MTREVFPIPKTSSRPRERKQGADRFECRAILAAVAAIGRCEIPGCTATDLEIHHSRVPGSGAAGAKKSGDDWAMLLCRDHHRGSKNSAHAGGELAFLRRFGIDPYALPARNRALLERPMP